MEGKLAFVFPGQGSQKTGMLEDLASIHPVIASTFAEASESLGYDLWEMVQHGTQDEINLTERTQPLMLAASVAIWRLWQECRGRMPSQLAGHSLGEWSALVCSNVIDLSSALKIVRQRGALMQTAVPLGEGTMAAILGLDDEVILEICANTNLEKDGEVSAVNFNAPGQVVIAGSAPSVEIAIRLCKAAGAKRALALPVSAPFHTKLMTPAAEGLEQLVDSTSFCVPQIPVIHNIHGKQESDPQQIKRLMLEQIYNPVRWVSCVHELRANGAEIFVECGPGRVLGGLIKRIDKQLVSFSTDDCVSFDFAIASA